MNKDSNPKMASDINLHPKLMVETSESYTLPEASKQMIRGILKEMGLF